MEITFTNTPPPPVTVAPPAPPTPPALSAEELEAVKTKAFEKMGWGEPPNEKPAVPPVEPAAVVPPVEPEPEPVIEEPEVPPAPTAKEIAREVSAEMATHQPAAPAAVPAPSFALQPADQADYEVLVYLQKAKPAKWAGMADKFVAYCKAHYAYIEQWKAAHVGEEYDAEANEHEAWYDRNQPEIEPNDILVGRASMEAEENAYNRVKAELAPMQRKQALEAAMPGIAQTVQRNVLLMIDQVNPELGKLLKDKDGKPMMTAESIALVEEADPVAKRVLDEVIKGELEPLVLELEVSLIPEVGMVLDPARNQKHAAIARFQNEAEADLLSAPAEVRNQHGKQFTTLADYTQRQRVIQAGSQSAADKNRALDDLEARYWTLSPDDLAAFMVDHYAKKAKNIIAIRDSDASRKHKVAPASGQPPIAPVVPAPVVTAPPIIPQAPARVPVGTKPNAPGGGSSSDAVPVGGGQVVPLKTFAENAAAKQFAR